MSCILASDIWTERIAQARVWRSSRGPWTSDKARQHGALVAASVCAPESLHHLQH